VSLFTSMQMHRSGAEGAAAKATVCSEAEPAELLRGAVSELVPALLSHLLVRKVMDDDDCITSLQVVGCHLQALYLAAYVPQL
jgi:hypothetical protein